MGDSPAKAVLNTAYDLDGGKWGTFGPHADWSGRCRISLLVRVKASPRRRSVAGLRGRPATLELRHGPDSYGRQQWGILDNGGNPDPAMPRAGRRPSGCKPLSDGKKQSSLIPCTNDGTVRRSTG